MKAAEIVLAIFIIFLFVMMSTFTLVVGEIQKMKNNWAEYRCHPSVMPFASFFGTDPVSNFTYCIANQQTVSSPYLNAGRDAVQQGLVNNASQMSGAFGGFAENNTNFNLNSSLNMAGMMGSIGGLGGLAQGIAGQVSSLHSTGQAAGKVISNVVGTFGGMMKAIWDGKPGKFIRGIGDL